MDDVTCQTGPSNLRRSNSKRVNKDDSNAEVPSKQSRTEPAGYCNNFLVSCIAAFEITVYFMFHREEATTTEMRFPVVCTVPT